MSEIFGRLRFLCSRLMLMRMLYMLVCSLLSSLMWWSVLMLECRQCIWMLCLLRKFVSFFVIFLVRVVISMCLLCLMCIWIFLRRLLICFFDGFMMIFGLMRLVGWMICFIMLLVMFILYLFGVVERQMVWLMWFLNLFYCSGWLFIVFGNWKLWLMRVCLWDVLFLYIVLICGMVMCDLLIISRKLFGKKLSSVCGGLFGMWLFMCCEQFLMFEQKLSCWSILRLNVVCMCRCWVLSSLF